jgi:hypothetical protein
MTLDLLEDILLEFLVETVCRSFSVSLSLFNGKPQGNAHTLLYYSSGSVPTPIELPGIAVD